MDIFDKVIEQIKTDITSNDYTAIIELIKNIDEHHLKAFLPENGYLWENEENPC